MHVCVYAYVHACPHMCVRMFYRSVKLVGVCVCVYVEDAYTSGQYADSDALCSVPTRLPLPLPTEIAYIHIYVRMYPGLSPVSCMVAPVTNSKVRMSSNSTEDVVECMRA